MPSNRQERGSYMAIDEGLSALSAARHNATYAEHGIKLQSQLRGVLGRDEGKAGL
jgi:hypothetical protein